MQDMSDKSRRTSKTVSEEKAKRIRQAVKGEHSSGVTASFRHWVNRTKKFELLNCAELELTDVLCLPVKAKVSKSRKIHLRACHAGSVYGWGEGMCSFVLLLLKIKSNLVQGFDRWKTSCFQCNSCSCSILYPIKRHSVHFPF